MECLSRNFHNIACQKSSSVANAGRTITNASLTFGGCRDNQSRSCSGTEAVIDSKSDVMRPPVFNLQPLRWKEL
jgi:hypothetical protein